MVAGDFSDPSISDPLCDEMYAICDICRSKPECDYFASGQVSQCVVIAGEMINEHPKEYAFGIDERLERCFDQIIRKAEIPVVQSNTPRRTGFHTIRNGKRGRC
jgi:hypothetical protein